MQNSMDKVITVPNILSFIRICLIPVIIWEYVFLKEYFWAAMTVVFSGITDIADGFIARRFNMVSHVGRILDPVADKLTQITVIACLCIRFTMMIIPLAILVVKELANGIIALIMLKRTGETINSEWHGKLATAFLYVMMITHLFWTQIPMAVSDISIGISIGLMAISFALYTLRNINAIKQTKKVKNESFDY